MSSPAPVPITILTGFLGSGKTTLLLNLLPQLPSSYKVCLLKNEFGDVAVDSQLAQQNSVAGVTEMLNGCICCNLVGQLSHALISLRDQYRPSRIIIETSGSAFPALLAMEVNRVSRENSGSFVLDGVVQVLDVENWTGYEDTSHTAKIQAKFTDLIVLNKHELAGPEKEDVVMDRIRDLTDETPVVRSNHGWISKDVVFGFDGGLARSIGPEHLTHHHEHASEVDVVSARLPALSDGEGYVDTTALHQLLTTAPKDEVYRIKGIVRSRLPPPQHPESTFCTDPVTPPASNRWILNWAFGRWTFTPLRESSVYTHIEAPEGKSSPVDVVYQEEHEGEGEDPEEYLRISKQALGRKGSIEVVVTTSFQRTIENGRHHSGEHAAQLTMVLARGEGNRWIKRLEKEGWVRYDNKEQTGVAVISKIV